MAGRSTARVRSKSRDRSESPTKSASRARSISRVRGRSKSRVRARSKSWVRSKSRTRSKSRARSTSRLRSTSCLRSKSKSLDKVRGDNDSKHSLMKSSKSNRRGGILGAFKISKHKVHNDGVRHSRSRNKSLTRSRSCSYQDRNHCEYSGKDRSGKNRSDHNRDRNNCDLDRNDCDMDRIIRQCDRKRHISRSRSLGGACDRNISRSHRSDRNRYHEEDDDNGSRSRKYSDHDTENSGGSRMSHRTEWLRKTSSVVSRKTPKPPLGILRPTRLGSDEYNRNKTA